jgi:hypothetical protein
VGDDLRLSTVGASLWWPRWCTASKVRLDLSSSVKRPSPIETHEVFPIVQNLAA